MQATYRSRRARLAALAKQLRATGQTWAQIAARIRSEEHVNARVAMRLSHGWTQSKVARLWNERWPAEDGAVGITDKNLSYWETWPHSGHEPSLKTLERLAQLYQCDVGNLIDDGSYSHLDKAELTGTPDGKQVASYEPAAAPSLPFGLPATGITVPGERVLASDLASLAFIGGQQSSDDRLGMSTAPLQRLTKIADEQIGSPVQREALYEQMVGVLATCPFTGSVELGV